MLFITGLLGYHIFLVSTNITTKEELKNSFKVFPYNPYRRSNCCGNWSLLFCNKRLPLISTFDILKLNSTTISTPKKKIYTQSFRDKKDNSEKTDNEKENIELEKKVTSIIEKEKEEINTNNREDETEKTKEKETIKVNKNSNKLKEIELEIEIEKAKEIEENDYSSNKKLKDENTDLQETKTNNNNEINLKNTNTSTNNKNIISYNLYSKIPNTLQQEDNNSINHETSINANDKTNEFNYDTIKMNIKKQDEKQEDLKNAIKEGLNFEDYEYDEKVKEEINSKIDWNMYDQPVSLDEIKPNLEENIKENKNEEELNIHAENKDLDNYNETREELMEQQKNQIKTETDSTAKQN